MTRDEPVEQAEPNGIGRVREAGVVHHGFEMRECLGVPLDRRVSLAEALAEAESHGRVCPPRSEVKRQGRIQLGEPLLGRPAFREFEPEKLSRLDLVRMAGSVEASVRRHGVAQERDREVRSREVAGHGSERIEQSGPSRGLLREAAAHFVDGTFQEVHHAHRVGQLARPRVRCGEELLQKGRDAHGGVPLLPCPVGLHHRDRRRRWQTSSSTP